MVSPLARRVQRAIRRRGLWTDADRVAVALSGGADSVALTLVVGELSRRAPWRLAGLIHVNHGLRGVESDDDEAFCRALAVRLQLPIDVSRVDVRGHAVTHKRSLEASARQLRYAVFEAAADRLGATIITTGHTADDQAETVLLRLFCGSGTRGVSAIRWKRDRYARPLLDERRSALRQYLDESGATFREDSSNLDVSVPRNCLRQGLMGRLDAEWPGAVSALARFAALAADDDGELTRQARASGARTVSATGGVELRRSILASVPVSLARRVIREAIEEAGGRPTAADIEAVARLAAPGGAGRVTLHRVSAETLGDVIRLGQPPDGLLGVFAYPLAVPGSLRIPETGDAIHASLIPGAPEATGPDTGGNGRGASELAALLRGGAEAGSSLALLQADSLRLPLTVRSRRPGDRLHYLGAPGSRKVQDLFVDRKVPVALRDRVPLVVDREGRIVWVAGLAIAHECRVTTPTGGMVKLKFDKKGHQ